MANIDEIINEIKENINEILNELGQELKEHEKPVYPEWPDKYGIGVQDGVVQACRKINDELGVCYVSTSPKTYLDFTLLHTKRLVKSLEAHKEMGNNQREVIADQRKQIEELEKQVNYGKGFIAECNKTIFELRCQLAGRLL